MTTPKTLVAAAVARYLDIKHRTFYNMLKDGRFPVEPLPDVKPRRWNREDLDAWLKGNYSPKNVDGE